MYVQIFEIINRFTETEHENKEREREREQATYDRKVHKSEINLMRTEIS